MLVNATNSLHSGQLMNFTFFPSRSVPSPSPAVQPKKRRRRESKKDKKDEKEVKRRMKGRIMQGSRQFPSHSHNFAGGETQVSNEHTLNKAQSSDPEEISSDSDAFRQGSAGPSRVSYKQEKLDFAGKPDILKGVLISRL